MMVVWRTKSACKQVSIAKTAIRNCLKKCECLKYDKDLTEVQSENLECKTYLWEACPDDSEVEIPSLRSVINE